MTDPLLHEFDPMAVCRKCGNVEHDRYHVPSAPPPPEDLGQRNTVVHRNNPQAWDWRRSGR